MFDIATSHSHLSWNLTFTLATTMETYPRYFQLLQLRSKLIIFKSHGFPVIGEINITF